MFFPIGDDQVKGGYFPLFSYIFIAINVLVFFYQASLSVPGFEQFVYTYGSIPRETLAGQDTFTLFTSMFLHGSWMHLLGNMLFLWIFADNIEATIGNFRFLVFYIIGGLAAHAGHIYFNMGSEIPTVGASGAISAVMGAYLVMYPTSKIKMLVLVFFVRVPAFIFLIFLDCTASNFRQSIPTIYDQRDGWCSLVGSYRRICIWLNRRSLLQAQLSPP